MPKVRPYTAITQPRSLLDVGFLFVILVVVIGVCLTAIVAGFKKHWVEKYRNSSDAI